MAERELLNAKGYPGYHIKLTPTYQGLVWDSKRADVEAESTARARKSTFVSKFGVPDHRAFLEALKTPEQEGAPVSVIFLEIDNFKSVNDNHSHKVGDQVIEETIRIAQRAVEGRGVVFHRSGDEILLPLPNLDESEAGAVGEHIRQTVEQTEYPVIGRGYVTATLGVATFPTSCGSLGDIEETADKAAMEAKTWKNTVALASQGEENKER
jgi:diguanylate cyclase (GGDEF)-like protein